MTEDEVEEGAAAMGDEKETSRPRWARRVWDLYYDGFRNMTVGRWLWALIIFKLIVIFLVLKLFFFPDLLGSNYDTDEERADAVRSELINRR